MQKEMQTYAGVLLSNIYSLVFKDAHFKVMSDAIGHPECRMSPYAFSIHSVTWFIS